MPLALGSLSPPRIPKAFYARCDLSCLGSGYRGSVLEVEVRNRGCLQGCVLTGSPRQGWEQVLRRASRVTCVCVCVF